MGGTKKRANKTMKICLTLNAKATENYLKNYQLENTAYRFKVTLCNNLTLFEVWFYRQLALVPSSNSF